MKKNYSGNFKTRIAVAMIREQETVAELAKKYELHRSLLTRMSDVNYFSRFLL